MVHLDWDVSYLISRLNSIKFWWDCLHHKLLRAVKACWLTSAGEVSPLSLSVFWLWLLSVQRGDYYFVFYSFALVIMIPSQWTSSALFFGANTRDRNEHHANSLTCWASQAFICQNREVLVHWLHGTLLLPPAVMMRTYCLLEKSAHIHFFLVALSCGQWAVLNVCAVQL